MASTYNCTVCNEEFGTKWEQQHHYRKECQMFVILTDVEGNMKRVERMDNKFGCPLCLKMLKYGNKLVMHWNRCSRREGTESNGLYFDCD